MIWRIQLRSREKIKYDFILRGSLDDVSDQKSRQVVCDQFRQYLHPVKTGGTKLGMYFVEINFGTGLSVAQLTFLEPFVLFFS